MHARRHETLMRHVFRCMPVALGLNTRGLVGTYFCITAWSCRLISCLTSSNYLFLHKYREWTLKGRIDRRPPQCANCPSDRAIAQRFRSIWHNYSDVTWQSRSRDRWYTRHFKTIVIFWLGNVTFRISTRLRPRPCLSTPKHFAECNWSYSACGAHFAEKGLLLLF